MVVTPGLREAVDASRSKHETAFAAEKKVRVRPVPWIARKQGRVKRRCAMLAQLSLQRACDWAQRLPPAKSSLPVSHAVATPSGADPSFIAHGTAALAERIAWHFEAQGVCVAGSAERYPRIVSLPADSRVTDLANNSHAASGSTFV